MVHRSISISIKETSDVYASKQQRRIKLAFILHDPTETSDYQLVFYRVYLGDKYFQPFGFLINLAPLVAF